MVSHQLCRDEDELLQSYRTTPPPNHIFRSLVTLGPANCQTHVAWLSDEFT